MQDYSGKTVYVGIDVHKKTYAVTCVCEGEVVKQGSMIASAEGLYTFLRRYFPGASINSAYEAGFSGFVLHRYLVNQGVNNRVVHAASIEISSRDRVKTDKRDSLKIAQQLSAGRLRGIRVPSVEREAYREITRLREKLASDKRRVGNRFKSLLYRQGLIGAEDVPVVTKKWLEKIVSDYQGNESIKYVLETLREEWLNLHVQLKRVTEALATQAQTDAAIDMIYQSTPGIGPYHARVLANELEDMKQFTNEKQLFSFTGLTPREYSSGEHKRQGHITRQGRSILRKTLLLAAWVAIKKDSALLKIFERISKTAGKKRAIIAIARRLIGRIRSCFINGCLYELNKTHTHTDVLAL
jgi:transposase